MKSSVKHIKLKAFPEAAEDILQENGDGSFTAYVVAKARGGEANKVILHLICKKFPGRSVRIVSGHQARNKIVEVK